MTMTSGTEDGYLVSILTQENGKYNFMMTMKQQKWNFQIKMSGW